MINKLIIFVVLMGFSFKGISLYSIPNDSIVQVENSKEKHSKFKFNFLPKVSLFNKADAQTKNKSKLVAGLLAIALGPFGVHRLYLGTAPKVPIAYTLTLGGGFFILPLIDIFYIILSRNPEDIENNNHVFIWNKKKTQN